MPKKQNKFHIGAMITLWTEIEVSAESLEDALEMAKGLDTKDFIEIYGEHNDSICKIISVCDMLELDKLNG